MIWDFDTRSVAREFVPTAPMPGGDDGTTHDAMDPTPQGGTTNALRGPQKDMDDHLAGIALHKIVLNRAKNLQIQHACLHNRETDDGSCACCFAGGARAPQHRTDPARERDDVARVERVHVGRVQIEQVRRRRRRLDRIPSALEIRHLVANGDAVQLCVGIQSYNIVIANHARGGCDPDLDVECGIGGRKDATNIVDEPEFQIWVKLLKNRGF